MQTFEDLYVSTTTLIAHTNINLSLKPFYDSLTVQSVAVPRSLKKKLDIEHYIIQQNYKDGSIISVCYKEFIKGFKIQPRKQWEKNPKKDKPFRNSVTISLIVGSKLINCKIPSNGKMHLTGCKNIQQAKDCIKHIFLLLPSTAFLLDEQKSVVIPIRTVMTNIVFSLKFNVNRENLDQYINCHTDFHSLFETSLGYYQGVNIKKRLTKYNNPIPCLTYTDGFWKDTDMLYEDFVAGLSEKDRKKELTKKRNTTFLVFYSGTIIMSGMSKEYMKDVYYEFIAIIAKERKYLEQKKS